MARTVLWTIPVICSHNRADVFTCERLRLAYRDSLECLPIAAGVDATAYAARMLGGELRVAILDKDADRDLTVDLDCESHRSGTVETATLHAPALDSRKTAMTPATPSGRLSHGRCTVTLPRARGMCLIFHA